MTQGRVTPPRKPQGKKHLPWSRYGELVDLLDGIIRDGEWSKRRDALAIVLGLHGLRISEVCNLRIDDLDPADRTIDVATLKGGLDRVVGLGRGVCESILDWRNGSDAKPLLFTGLGTKVHPNQFRAAFHDVWRVVSPCEYEHGKQSRYHFHSLRHTFAMRTLHNTKNSTVVAGRLGHRSLTATAEYTLSYGQLSNDQIKEIGIDIAEVPALACAEPVGSLRLFAG